MDECLTTLIHHHSIITKFYVFRFKTNSINFPSFSTPFSLIICPCISHSSSPTRRWLQWTRSTKFLLVHITVHWSIKLFITPCVFDRQGQTWYLARLRLLLEVCSSSIDTNLLRYSSHSPLLSSLTPTSLSSATSPLLPPDYRRVRQADRSRRRARLTTTLNKLVDGFWPEISTSVPIIESLYEDEEFGQHQRQLAALLVSKAYVNSISSTVILSWHNFPYG